jgi:DMSO/TMAO reductase YedYZ molybdopterin-dependent catalytic subunit
VAQARGPDVVLAYEMNGQPLTVEHGFPLRLVVPGSYGYKSVKWVEKVEAVSLGSDGYKGYWEKQGYPAQAGIL